MQMVRVDGTSFSLDLYAASAGDIWNLISDPEDINVLFLCISFRGLVDTIENDWERKSAW